MYGPEDKHPQLF